MKADLILDFDDTLFQTKREIILFLNKYFDIQIPINANEYVCGNSFHELVMKHLPSTYNLSKEELYEIFGSQFLASERWHEHVLPVVGALEIIPQLAQRYTLHIATARQKSSKPVVDMLLEKFFPGLISSTHFVWEHLGDCQFQGVPKKDFVKTLRNPIGYVDDNPRETLDMMGVVSHVVLFDPEGYHSTNADASHRVSHWNEVGRLFL